MKTNLLISGILLGAVTFIRAATNDLTTAIQRGLFEEEANQNLGAAIQAYQSVANQFDKDRKLAATAIFRLGECYRKQGNTNDAAAQYERIFRDFSDQPTLVTLSRQNLDALGTPPPATAAPALSDAARQEKKRLLEEDLKLLQMALESQGEVLSQYKFQELVESNQIARAAIIYNTGSPDLRNIVGTYWKSESNGKAEAPFRAKVRLLPELETKLLSRPQVKVSLWSDLAALRRQLAAISAELGAGMSAPSAPVLSDAARQEQKRLLEEEIKLVQQELDKQQKLVQNQALSQGSLLPTERDLLHLKRQLAALDAGLPVSFAAPETTAPAISTEAEEVKRIQALIKDSPDLINAPDGKGETLLQSAATKGNLAVVKLLLDSGAAVDGLQQPGLTALHYAAANGHKAVVDLLLSRGAKADAQFEAGVTPLHLAALKGYEAVAKSLLAAGAPVDAKTKGDARRSQEDLQYYIGSGQTPLHLAAVHGYGSLAQLLLAKGANVNSKEVSGLTALHRAVAGGYTGLVEMLLAKGANANAEDESGRTPLHLAAKGDSTGLVKLLLAKGANVNAQDREGRTRLSYAAEAHSEAITQLLLAAHANPNAGQHDPPLAVAATIGDMPTLKLLLANGADPNTNNAIAWPLFLAVANKHADAVAELLRFKANPNRLEVNGDPLTLRALSDAPTLKALLDGGADPNARSHGGTTPVLLQAVHDKNQPAVELLLAHHAEVNCTGSIGETPLLAAVEVRNRPIAELLLKAGADLNARFDDNASGYSECTPLYQAVRHQQPDLVELLLANKANPNAKCNNGWTPLHQAVWDDKRELVELLLSHGADPNVRNNAGRTPLDLNREPKQTLNLAMRKAIAELLHQHGALDDLPALDRIEVRRRAAISSATVLKKGTNDWNQFTLLELLGVEYNLLQPLPPRATGPYPMSLSFMGASGLQGPGLPFPDLAHLHIRRPAPDLKTWEEQVVDLTPLLQSGDCTKDLPLKWGDVVEIPETDHPLNAIWSFFPGQEASNLKRCLARRVEIFIKGQGTKITLEPSNHAASFLLNQVLLASNLLLASSDLAHVKVTRRGPASGQQREWVVDCSGDQNPDFWLRDGDKIEVPEKTDAPAAAQAPGPQSSPK